MSFTYIKKDLSSNNINRKKKIKLCAVINNVKVISMRGRKRA